MPGYIPPESVLPQPQRSVMARKEPSPYTKAALTAGEFALWLPKTVLGIIKDPAGFVEENPLDVAMLLLAPTAHKGIKNIRAKVKAKKPLTPADFELIAKEAPGIVEDLSKYSKYIKDKASKPQLMDEIFNELQRVSKEVAPKERRRWDRAIAKKPEITKLTPEELVKRKEYLQRLKKEYGEDLKNIDEFMKEVPDVGAPPIDKRRVFVKGDITGKIRRFEKESKLIDTILARQTKPKKVVTKPKLVIS
jgi:hypothetical protein